VAVRALAALSTVIPAQAGIQFFAPGFRVSRCSPGMTGCHEWPVRVEDFVSEQRSEESQAFRGPI
jgi:hypothetical protein